MRIDVEKYLMIGPTSRKDLFFKKIQEVGIVELISMNNRSLEKSSDVETYVEALHILRRKFPVKQQWSPSDTSSSIVLARNVLDTNEELEKLLEERRLIEKEIARTSIFGDFSTQELHDVETQTKRNIQFFFAKAGKSEEAKKREEVIYVGSRSEIDYFVAINPEKRSYEGLIEMTIDRPVGDLEENLAEINRKIDTLEVELQSTSHHKKFIQSGLIKALNAFHLEEAEEKADTLFEGSLFTVLAWVPKNKAALFKQVCQEWDVYTSTVAIEDEDKRPTYLENKGVAKFGEDLVNIYDVPSHADRDPSFWVYSAFLLFFSMIIGDAGYGLLLLGISSYLYRKFAKKSSLAKRVISLSITLSIGCIIWGILAASFFGLSFAPESRLRSLSLIDWMAKKKAEYVITHRPVVYEELVKAHPGIESAKTGEAFLTWSEKKEGGKITYPIHEEFLDNIMLELVIFIGCIHIILSFLRYLDRTYAGIGWVIFMIGGYLYFPSILRATSLIHYLFDVPEVEGAAIGLYILFAGIAIAFILALIQKGWVGLIEPMQVIQVFADVMSYLRIYALALAGMIMATTFNDIAGKAPFILGLLIIFFGHGVNFTLALMGGLIHGLRLNFIEWYHYSFEGGGRSFRPLALRSEND